MNDRPNPETPDFDYLLQANLARIFSERDPGLRMAAVRELYLEDAVLYEPTSLAQGHSAIADAVTALLDSLPEDFGFNPLGSAIGHHNVGRLKWTGGPAGGPIVITGIDVAHFDGGRIQSLYVFLDPTDA